MVLMLKDISLFEITGFYLVCLSGYIEMLRVFNIQKYYMYITGKK